MDCEGKLTPETIGHLYITYEKSKKHGLRSPVKIFPNKSIQFHGENPMVPGEDFPWNPSNDLMFQPISSSPSHTEPPGRPPWASSTPPRLPGTSSRPGTPVRFQQQISGYVTFFWGCPKTSCFPKPWDVLILLFCFSTSWDFCSGWNIESRLGWWNSQYMEK